MTLILRLIFYQILNFLLTEREREERNFKKYFIKNVFLRKEQFFFTIIISQNNNL